MKAAWLLSPVAGKEFAVLPMDELKKLMDDAEMLSDVKACDAAKLRLSRGEDGRIPFDITEPRLAGESPAKNLARVSRAHLGRAGEEIQYLAPDDCGY